MLTFLIELDPAVDTPVEVTAEWYGHSSISDSPHVAFTQTSEEPPYYASVSFSPLQQSDVGTYVVTVQLFSISDEVLAVKNSGEIHVSMCLSIR